MPPMFVREAEGPFPRSLAYHDPSVFMYPTDLDKAKALLQEAGWVDGTEVTYAYYPGFHGEDVGPILQAQLEQIGIKLKIQELVSHASLRVQYVTEADLLSIDPSWRSFHNVNTPEDLEVACSLLARIPPPGRL